MGYVSEDPREEKRRKGLPFGLMKMATANERMDGCEGRRRIIEEGRSNGNIFEAGELDPL